MGWAGAGTDPNGSGAALSRDHLPLTAPGGVFLPLFGQRQKQIFLSVSFHLNIVSAVSNAEVVPLR